MNEALKCNYQDGCTFGHGGNIYPGPDNKRPWLCKMHASEAWTEWKKEETKIFYEQHPEYKPKVVRGDVEEKKWKESQKKEKKGTVSKDGVKRGAISEVTDRLLKDGGTVPDMARAIAKELNIQRDLEMNVTVRIYVLKKRGVKFEEKAGQYFKITGGK